MKTKILSRRNFINKAALSALAACICGCTKPVTRYRPDGTPYTEDVDDPAAALAGIVLLLIILGVFAASQRKDDDGYSLNDEDDWQYLPNDKTKIWSASMVNENNIPSSETEGKISVMGPNGKLLAVANGSANIQHKDLPALESILSSANICNLQKPLAVRLKKAKSSIFQIESVRSLNKSSKGKNMVIERNIDGKCYKIKVFSCSDNEVAIEVEPSIPVNQNVA